MSNTGPICPDCADERREKWQARYQNLKLEPGLFVQAKIAEEHGAEHMWFTVIQEQGTAVLGKLENDPTILKLVKCGDNIPFFRSHIEAHIRDLKLGDIVMLRLREFLGEEPGTFAYIYESYPDFDHPELLGYSIITENGVNLGGFSADEASMFLVDPVESGFEYEFKNVIKLDQDFETLIKHLFK